MRRSLALLATLGFGLGLGAAGSPPPRELRFEKFNRVYSDLVGSLAPFESGPITVRLSSPKQTVYVRDHVARMTPLGGGRAQGSLEIEVLGKGELVADVDLAGQASRFEDLLIVPPQRLELDGTVRLTRVEGGYRVFAERAPESVTVEIRSQLVNRISSACEAAALFTFGALDCAPVTRSLERPRIPLPAEGREFFLGDEDLDDGDRAELDALIAAR